MSSDWYDTGKFILGISFLILVVYINLKSKGKFITVGSKNVPWWRREYIFAFNTPKDLKHFPVDTSKSFAQKMRELFLYLAVFLGVLALGIFLIKGGMTLLVSGISTFYPSHL